MSTRILSPFFLLLILSAYLVGCIGTKKTSQPGNTETTTAKTDSVKLGEFALIGKENQKRIDLTQFTRKAIDIPYANTSNARQTLDIIYPLNGPAPYKCIVVFHGGGWAAGDKQSETLAPIFEAANQGYAVISVNLRLAGEVTWPKPLHDAKAAIRYVRANAFRHLLDARNIVVWGTSTGGHIVEMLAATNNQPGFEDLSMGNATISSEVQGSVTWYGISDITTLPDAAIEPANKIMGFNVRENKDKAKEASPVNLVTKTFPPLLLVHGTNDQVVPFEQSVNMEKTVNEITGRNIATLKRYQGAGHGDATIRSPKNVAEDLNFIDRILFNGKNPYRSTSYLSIKVTE